MTLSTFIKVCKIVTFVAACVCTGFYWKDTIKEMKGTKKLGKKNIKRIENNGGK